MKKKKILIVAFIMIFIFGLNIIVFNINIFDINRDISTILRSVDNTKNVCILEYQYTTGSGWNVKYDKFNKLKNNEVALYSYFDPRLLKDNKDFDLDYMASYVVIVDTVDTIIVDGEQVIVIYPDDIIVNYNTDKTVYKVADFSIQGILKGVIGFFNKAYRISY